jgi:hydroxyacylglutathione hydrolase
VVDPHVELVDDYLATAAALGAPIVAAFETHLQADHVSGLPALVERSVATAYLPAGAGVEFEHVALADGDTVELGNTLVTAVATPGTRPPTTPTPSPIVGAGPTSRGSSSAATRS